MQQRSHVEGRLTRLQRQKVVTTKCPLQQALPSALLTLNVHTQKVGNLGQVVDAEEALLLAGGVGAHHPRQSERTRGECFVGVGSQDFLALGGRDFQDCFVYGISLMLAPG